MSEVLPPTGRLLTGICIKKIGHRPPSPNALASLPPPNFQQILVGVGDMIGPPGCDPSKYSSASIAVDLGLYDTVRDVKKKIIVVASWKDELPDDFGLFDDTSEEPLKDAIAIESALAYGKSAPVVKGSGAGGTRRGLVWNKAPASIRLPRPYVGVVWAARL